MPYRLENSGARAVVTNAAGHRKTRGNSRSANRLEARSLDRRRRRTAQLHFIQRWRVPLTTSCPLDTCGRRPGADDLHVRHDRTAQGRAARPSRTARALPGVAASIMSSFRSPATGSGRRRTGPGPAGLLNCCCPASRSACPVVARKFDKFDPEEAFALMAEADVRNAFIPPTALRMLRAAGSRRSARLCAAHRRLRRRGAWRRDLRMGTRDARPHGQRILRPDRMQHRVSSCARSASQSPARSASPCRATTSRSSAATARVARRRDSARSRSGGRTR